MFALETLAYVRTRNTSVHPPTVAYVHSRGLVFWLLFSKGFKALLGYH
jgi:hypothetical protein